MAFENYNIADNAFSTLLTWISASDTTIELQAADGDKFPSSNFILTLVQYETTWDESTTLQQSEKVLCTSRTDDTLTVTRWFDWDTPLDFDSWDNVYLNVVARITEDIQDETVRLETDKLDTSTFNSSTRDNLTAYRLLYIDWNWEETELGLWSAGQVLISQWTASNPIWQAQTTDIDWLTNDDTLWEDDKLVFFKSWTWNRKRTAKASETVPWLVERATDEEATDWTEENKFITPKQAKYNYGTQILPAENTIISWWDTSTATSSSTYVKRWEFTINTAGKYRAKARVRTTSWWAGDYTADVAIYKNGDFVAEWTTGSWSGAWRIWEVSTDVEVIDNDRIEAYIKVNNDRSCRLYSFTLNWFLFNPEWFPDDTF